MTDPRRQAALLVVDDDKHFGRSLVAMMQRHCDVTIETSGERGARIGESEAEFDLVLLDLYMPDLTGAEIYERWARTAPARLRRLVFASAGADHPVIAPWLEKTGVPVLHKPFDASKLVSEVERFARLSLSRGPRDSISRPQLPRPPPIQRPPTPPSMPQLPSSESRPPRPSQPRIFTLDFEGDEPDTDVIDLALARGAPPEVVAELRIRRLHKSQTALVNSVAVVQGDVVSLKNDIVEVKADVSSVKGDVSSIKTTVDDLKTYRAKADASVKTVMIVCTVITVLVGAGYELIKTFVFHAY